MGTYIEKFRELLENPNSKMRTISSQAGNGRFNDYPEKEYTQASGSAKHP